MVYIYGYFIVMIKGP